MESEVITIHADKKPIEGIPDPSPHQTYKDPRIFLEKRKIGALLPDEIRVQMLYAGICGTDVHLTKKNKATGYISSSAPVEIPGEGRIIGHEGVGIILETGKEVRHLQSDSIVIFESIIVCHYCDVCRRGNFNQCRHAKLLGLEKDGIFRTVADVPAMLAHDVTGLVKSDKDLKAVACVEPAGVAYVACQNTGLKGGDRVVVFGAGPIGLYTAMLSKVIFGASVVHMVEPLKFRRNFAKKWCDRTYSTEEFFASPPEGIDAVFEASGVLNNISRIFRHINPNGRIALLARSGVPLTLDAMDHMITNAIQIIGSRGHLGGAFIDILNLYKEGRIPLDEIVTSVVNGPGELLDMLGSPEKIFNENCKVLAQFAEWKRP